MSVLSVSQMWSRNSGSFEADRYFTYANKASITEAYQVVAEIGDTSATIESSPLLPRYGDQHSSGRLAYVRSIQAEQVGPIFWVATVRYDGDFEDDIIQIEWTDTATSEPIDRDWDGAAITTVNGEPVEGLTVDVADQVAVITRKFLAVNTYGIAMYRRATNSDTFLGWPPGTARLVGYSATNKFFTNAPIEQWTVTARIQFRQPYANTTPAQAWYKRWRHEGLWVKAGGTVVNGELVGGIIQRALDEKGQESPKPVLLDQYGRQERNPDAAVFIHTQAYDSLPYSGLGLL